MSHERHEFMILVEPNLFMIFFLQGCYAAEVKPLKALVNIVVDRLKKT